MTSTPVMLDISHQCSGVVVFTGDEKAKDTGCPIEPGMTETANTISRRLRAWLRPGPAPLLVARIV